MPLLARAGSLGLNRAAGLDYLDRASYSKSLQSAAAVPTPVQRPAATGSDRGTHWRT
jgi:hypothetical protein